MCYQWCTLSEKRKWSVDFHNSWQLFWLGRPSNGSHLWHDWSSCCLDLSTRITKLLGSLLWVKYLSQGGCRGFRSGWVICFGRSPPCVHIEDNPWVSTTAMGISQSIGPVCWIAWISSFTISASVFVAFVKVCLAGMPQTSDSAAGKAKNSLLRLLHEWISWLRECLR